MTSSHRQDQSDPHEESIGLLRLGNDGTSSPTRRSQRTVGSKGQYERILISAMLRLKESFNSLFNRHSLMSFIWFCVPSFLQFLRQHRNHDVSTKPSPTAYLDGMRGLASFSVLLLHWSFPCFDTSSGWGRNDDAYSLLRLPIVRLAYGGDAGVSLFFLISGYALSYRAIKHIRKKEFQDFATGLSSTTFRRLFRLYLPIVASTFMICCLLQLGVYDWAKPIYTSKKFMPHAEEEHPEKQADIFSELKHWVIYLSKMVYLFGWDRFYPPTKAYDGHLWTIPIEYYCSLHLFVIIIGTARLRTFWRCSAFLLTALTAYRHSRWELIMFIAGMALAEWDHIRDAHSATSGLVTKRDDPQTQLVKTVSWLLVSVVGLYLMSYPEHAKGTPGYVWLSTWIPKWWSEKPIRIWHGIGSTTFALAVSYSPLWKQFYNSAIVQYLGKISYALYLVHGPILHTVGCFWMKMAWGVTGLEGQWYSLGFALSGFFVIPTAVWTADIFWRAVDLPSIQLAKWIEKQVVFE